MRTFAIIYGFLHISFCRYGIVIISHTSQCHGWHTHAQCPGDQSRCQHRAEQRSASAEVPEQAPSENQLGCFVEDNQLLGQDKALSQSVAQWQNLPEVKAHVKAWLYITSVLQVSPLDSGRGFDTTILNQRCTCAPAFSQSHL
ncbi:hypothetical protein EDD16DRAFT_975581 [Pisolithus croceorrhizus]|nr:hypothetical protein EDD16DRAFT_975581 [Pisolithus croceorrhizus]